MLGQAGKLCTSVLACTPAGEVTASEVMGAQTHGFADDVGECDVEPRTLCMLLNVLGVTHTHTHRCSFDVSFAAT